MEKTLTGKAFVLGNDIDTDQIIPAEYLSYNPSDPAERKYFGMYANAGVPLPQSGLPEGNIPFVEKDKFSSEYHIIIGGDNFGCGSSREHAPLALAEAGVKAVVATFYARIFFRNCVNGGYLLPMESTESLVEQVQTGNEVSIDTETGVLSDLTTGKSWQLKPLGDVAPIIEAGGVFNYAAEQGMITG